MQHLLTVGSWTRPPCHSPTPASVSPHDSAVSASSPALPQMPGPPLTGQTVAGQHSQPSIPRTQPVCLGLAGRTPTQPPPLGSAALRLGDSISCSSPGSRRGPRHPDQEREAPGVCDREARGAPPKDVFIAWRKSSNSQGYFGNLMCTLGLSVVYVEGPCRPVGKRMAHGSATQGHGPGPHHYSRHAQHTRTSEGRAARQSPGGRSWHTPCSGFAPRPCSLEQVAAPGLSVPFCETGRNDPSGIK